jgi:hypothetical protein
MPRLIDPALQQMLERANPNVAHFVELNVPDTALVLRRALDQFLAVPPKVAESPAASIEADGAGALTLKRSAATLSFHSTGTNEAALPRPNPAKHLQGLAWIVDPNFGRGVLRSFTARIKLNPSGVPLDSGLQLQIYRVVGQAGRVNGSTAAVAYTFVPLLAQPITKKQSDVVWSGGVADVVFDLSTAYVEVGSNNLPAPSTARTGEKAVYYFVIEPVNASRDDDFFWIYDLGTAQDNVFNVGTFTARSWDRTEAQANDATAWVETPVNQVPRFSCDLQAFVATSEVVYSMVLPAAPTAASVGRIVFESGIPVGTSATLELSVAGFGGPYGVVKHDDPIPVKLPSYYLRLTMNASANQRLAPRIAALGIEFKIPVDVTAEAIVETVGQEIERPVPAGGDRRRPGARSCASAAATIATPPAELAVAERHDEARGRRLLGSRHPRSRATSGCSSIARVREQSRTHGDVGAFGLLSYRKTAQAEDPRPHRDHQRDAHRCLQRLAVGGHGHGRSARRDDSVRRTIRAFRATTCAFGAPRRPASRAGISTHRRQQRHTAAVLDFSAPAARHARRRRPGRDPQRLFHSGRTHLAGRGSRRHVAGDPHGAPARSRRAHRSRRSRSRRPERIAARRSPIARLATRRRRRNSRSRSRSMKRPAPTA